MLSNPSELSSVSVNVRRFLNQIQKVHARQACRHKSRQTLRFPASTDWMRTMCEDKYERQHVLDCTNEIIQHTGWQIIKSMVEAPRRALLVVVVYKASRDEAEEI